MHFLTALQFGKRVILEDYGFLYGNLGHVYAKQGRLNEARSYLAQDIEWSIRKNRGASAASAAYLIGRIDECFNPEGLPTGCTSILKYCR
jgi:hypothetical protein